MLVGIGVNATTDPLLVDRVRCYELLRVESISVNAETCPMLVDIGVNDIDCS